MAEIDASEMQYLVEKVEAIKKTLNSKGKKGRRKIETINPDKVLERIPCLEGKVDSGKWDGLAKNLRQQLHYELSRVLADMEAATAPCGYGAALVATSIFLPCAAAVFTVIIVLVERRPDDPLAYSLAYCLAPVWGTLGAFAAWLVFSGFYRQAADAKHAIPSSYGELLPRLDELAAGLKGLCPAAGSPPNNPCTNVAYNAAVRQHNEIRKDLDRKGLTWVLATGYSKVWGRLCHAEEAMIEVAPQNKVLEGAYYDEARLEGSDIKNREDLLAQLRKAVVSLDPSAYKYLKSTAAVAAPPALAIGTTALPGGTVAVGYCAPLLATGGVPPYKWAVIGGAMPEGLVLSTTGVLHGTPTSDGNGHFTVQVVDSARVAVEKYFDLLISPQTQATPSPLAFSTTPPLPSGTVGVEYAERLFATGGKPPYTWTKVDGTIPDGTHLSHEGVLSGGPAKDGTFEFEVKVADSMGLSPSPPTRKFTLFIKPSGTSAAAPVGGTQPEQLARAVLRCVRLVLNEYRNARWNGLIVARNRLLATFMLTGMIVFALLAIAIMSGAARSAIIAATVFYLVGATTGLCNRLRSESQAESAIPDYGLSAARLITLPLFSGLGAIGGLLLVAYLPFASPVFDASLSSAKTSTTQISTGNNPATRASAAAGGTTEEAAPKALPPAPKLEDIFSFERNLIGIFVALVFGLTPGLLFDRLQQHADRYKADLKSSQSTGATQKS